MRRRKPWQETSVSKFASLGNGCTSTDAAPSGTMSHPCNSSQQRTQFTRNRSAYPKPDLLPKALNLTQHQTLIEVKSCAKNLTLLIVYITSPPHGPSLTQKSHPTLAYRRRFIPAFPGKYNGSFKVEKSSSFASNFCPKYPRGTETSGSESGRAPQKPLAATTWLAWQTSWKKHHVSQGLPWNVI